MFCVFNVFVYEKCLSTHIVLVCIRFQLTALFNSLFFPCKAAGRGEQ